MDVDEEIVEDAAEEAEQHSDSSSSDKEDDDMEEESSRKITELEERLLQSPYEYKTHVDLIELLRNAGELDKLREARAKMAKIFPLTQTLWLEWIEDEKKFADTEEDHTRIVELFEKAVRDYMCPEVWLEYCQYCIRWMDSPDGFKKIRDVMERAIAAVGLHVTEGAALWEMYREFENALQLNMQPQPGSIPSQQQQEKIQKQMDKISSLFKAQLAVPLLDMERTYQEYEEWCDNNVDPSTRHMYGQSLKQLEELKPLENALLNATVPKLEQYQNYIQHEIKSGSSARIQCIYERALVENCLNSELWTQYLKYMTYQRNPPELVAELHLRSVRNCPWTGQLWTQYLVALERSNASKQKLDGVFEEAMNAGFTSAVEYVELWRTRCSQIRRRISSNEDSPDKTELSEFFSKAIQHITETVTQAFGESGDPCYTMWTFWSRCEVGIVGNKDKAIEILHKLTQDDVDARRKISIWKEFYDIERLYGGEDKFDKCRSILRQAVQNCAILPDKDTGGVPDAEIACEMLLDFERLHGNLTDMDESLKRVTNKLLRIAQRREKETAGFVDRQQKNKQWQQKQQKNQKQQVQRKRKASDDGQEKGRRGGGPPKQQKKDNRSPSSTQNQDFKAPAGLPVRYVKKTKPTQSSEEPTGKSKGPPPGFKASPPPGFKGPPPGYKQPSSDRPKTSDENNNKGFADKIVAVQSTGSESSDDINKKTIFVSNIDFKLSNVEKKLRKVFCDCGKICDIRLVKNNKGQFRGFGYIEFSDEGAVTKALKLDREILEGRPLYVSPNVDKKKQPDFKVFKYDLGLEKHKLFVSNLSFHTTEERLKEEFSKHGSLKNARIVTNRRGLSKGLAYVEFEKESEAAQAVLKMDGKDIEGFAIKVAISNPPSRKPAAEYTSVLGASREQFKGGRGRGRTQLSMVPRSINRSEKSTNGQKILESQPSTSGGMTNKDFAKLLLKK